MSKIDRIIFGDLLSAMNYRLLTFTLYSRHRIKPDKMFRFILKYTQLGYIKYENNIMEMTDIGKEHLFASFNSRSFYVNKENYNVVPEQFKSDRLKIEHPYLPNFSKLPQELKDLIEKYRGEGNKN